MGMVTVKTRRASARPSATPTRWASNPGKRDDVIVSADRPGMWRFHCHILRHVEGIEGMFGMVNTLIVTPTKVDLTPLLT
jgi:FtsP/CotA-like multicopper oxidase with cupredoxin domain